MMVRMEKKTLSCVQPLNPGAIVAGLIGVTILNGNQPYPDQTITPKNLTVSVTEV